MNVGEVIKDKRQKMKLTQMELAELLKVMAQAVSRWETGQCCPDIQHLPDIARLFEVSVDELLGYTPASTSEDIMLLLFTG